MNGISSPYTSVFKNELQCKQWQLLVEEIQKGKVIPFLDQYEIYKKISNDWPKENGPFPVWVPKKEISENSNISALINDLGLNSYRELHQWSVNHRIEFWEKVIQKLGIRFKTPYKQILNWEGDSRTVEWLSGAQFNCVDSCFSAPPDKTAIVYGKEETNQLSSISYGELERSVNRIANGLVENGFNPGDRIALYMPMTYTCIATYLAIIKVGCTVVSIADSFSAEKVKRRMQIAKAKAIVTVYTYKRAGKSIALYEKIKGIAPTIVINAPTPNDLSSLDIRMEDLKSKSCDFTTRIQAPRQYINILFSSGTTSEPKAIPWNHTTPIKCAMDGMLHQDIHSNDIVAWPTNIGWMMGPWLIFASLMNKATIAIYEGAPYGEGFFNFVEDSKISILGLVPSLVKNWRKSNLVEQNRWKNIRIFSSTGEPSDSEDYLWLMSRCNYQAPVIEYLGGTEIGGGHLTGTIVQPASPSTFSTPALGIDFKILNDKDQEVAEGESGELYLIPPSIGLSQELLNKDHHEIYYHNCPSLPAKNSILRRHGDQITKLHNGYYQAQGRTDDTMNLGGIKISSVELEDIINHHPAIYESVAISVFSSIHSTEQLVIYIVALENPDLVSLKAELQALISQKINPLFKIHKVINRKSLPRTASNKLMRRKLREDYIKSTT